MLLVPSIKDNFSGFELGLFNSFSRHNLLRSLSFALLLLWHDKYGTKNVQKTTLDSTFEVMQLSPIRKLGKQQENLPWN